MNKQALKGGMNLYNKCLVWNPPDRKTITVWYKDWTGLGLLRYLIEGRSFNKDRRNPCGKIFIWPSGYLGKTTIDLILSIPRTNIADKPEVAGWHLFKWEIFY